MWDKGNEDMVWRERERKRHTTSKEKRGAPIGVLSRPIPTKHQRQIPTPTPTMTPANATNTHHHLQPYKHTTTTSHQFFSPHPPLSRSKVVFKTTRSPKWSFNFQLVKYKNISNLLFFFRFTLLSVRTKRARKSAFPLFLVRNKSRQQKETLDWWFSLKAERRIFSRNL